MDLGMDEGQGGKGPQQQGCVARVGGVWMRQRRARSKVVVEWRNKEGGRGGESGRDYSTEEEMLLR